MPESVQVYVDSKSLKESFLVHQELCDSFRNDFSKYHPRVNRDCLDSVLTGVARYVGQQTIYTHLAEGYTHPTIKKAFETLCMARAVHKVSSASPSGLPLGASVSSRKFKAIMVDSGIWQNCPFGIVFSSAPFSEMPDQRIKFFPLYFAFSAIKYSYT